MSRIRTITAPESFTNNGSGVKKEFIDHPKVFLAGGITDCPDWQSDLIKLIATNTDYDLPDKPPLGVYLFNPRRESFDLSSKLSVKQQIAWEYSAMKHADIISYWFSRGSLNPITLFELGSHLLRNIIVGVDADYPRRFDVIEQLSLSNPDLTVQHRLEDMADQILLKSAMIKYPNIF